MMNVKLIYSTPNYHKLVESVMRICYQSYDKENENSHKSVRAIMAKGHLSIASVGNIVFEIERYENEYKEIASDLLHMQEINQFIKWSTPYSSKNDNGRFLVSMNMLTFLDLYKSIDMNDDHNETFYFMLQEVNKVPQLRWFYDKTVDLPGSVNQYSGKGCPELYEPIVLDEDCTKLKALGLNDYELGIHATITMNFVTDRSMSLQFWRHAASVGGCELSQRYVDISNTEYRIPIGIDKDLAYLLKTTNKMSINTYKSILQYCEKNGIRKGRAKELGRSILTNSIHTQLIQCRTYRNWMHLFKLRDDKHAQIEIQEDVRAIKRVLHEIGVKVD